MKYMPALIALLIAAYLLLCAAFAWRAFDAHVTHFEDGSGRVTYCVPFTPCTEE